MEQPQLKSVIEGDEAAVRAFVQAELPKVFALCCRLCLTREDAEDLSQEVFIKAIRGVANFKGESLVSTWLHQITLNTWKNKVRAEKSRRRLDHVSLSPRDSDDESPRLSPLETLAEKTRSVEELVEHQDFRAQVLDTLHELEDDEKMILILKDIEDRSYEDISKLMNLNLGTVKSRLSRARLALRTRLSKKGILNSP